MIPKYYVDGSSTIWVEDGERTYAVWRIVRQTGSMEKALRDNDVPY